MASVAEFALRMHDTIDLHDDEQVAQYLQTFEELGEQFVGIRRRPLREDTNVNWEIGPKGMVAPDRSDYGLYVVYGGTPHHTAGMFGYWHINDIDEFYIRIPPASGDPDDDLTVIIIQRKPRPGEQEMFAWYCRNPDCLDLLYCEVFDSGNRNEGFPGLWRAEHEAVRRFNADPALRACRRCGTEHPLAYRFWAPANSEEEEAARTLW